MYMSVLTTAVAKNVVDPAFAWKTWSSYVSCRCKVCLVWAVCSHLSQAELLNVSLCRAQSVNVSLLSPAHVLGPALASTILIHFVRSWPPTDLLYHYTVWGSFQPMRFSLFFLELIYIITRVPLPNVYGWRVSPMNEIVLILLQYILIYFNRCFSVLKKHPTKLWKKTYFVLIYVSISM